MRLFKSKGKKVQLKVKLQILGMFLFFGGIMGASYVLFGFQFTVMLSLLEIWVQVTYNSFRINQILSSPVEVVERTFVSGRSM